jgi:hypothetical protein
MIRTALYTRAEDKKHSTIYEPPADNKEEALGRVYVRKASGLTDAKQLRITVETVAE